MADKTPPRRGLGRGLSALMADLGSDLGASVPGAGEAAPPPRPDRMLPVEALRPNPDQPRRSFPEAELAELAESLKVRGVIQPLIVRPDPGEPQAFQIVAGERRWRAAQAAGLMEVPVLVRDYGDQELLEIAIIENVQRADLNAIDEGGAYRQLMERFGHTQEQVAAALGKSRSHIANQMRLLSLPPEVREMVADHRLSAGHARPLIGHPRALALARRVVERRLSVREVERLSKAPSAPPSGASRAAASEKDADTAAIERDLGAILGMAVRIDHDRAKGSGRVTIAYLGLDGLDDLLKRLSGG